MKTGSLAFTKRCISSLLLGILFGLLCVYLASGTNPEIWGSALMWSILLNRFMIGFTIGLVGVYSHHPCFGLRLYPALRGAILGAIVSVQMAVGVFMGPVPDQVLIFWITIVVGAFYGLIIDLVASKFGGEGKVLLAKNNF